MFNPRSSGDNGSTDDHQLDNNLVDLQEQLCCMMESHEIDPQTPPEEPPRCSAHNVLSELQRSFGVLQLDNNAPTLEFHGLGCPLQENMQHKPKRSRRHRVGQRSAVGAPEKKQKTTGNGQNNPLVSEQKQVQLQKENIWNLCMIDPAQIQMAPFISVEKLRSIGLHGDCLEHNAVLRLMDLFRSVHDHISADLSCSRQNSMPSDYLFDMPARATMPRSLNVRYQLQVLCTKVERFLTVQRRILESNRHFDYEKYTECDKLLNGSNACLKSFKQYMAAEMRHNRGNFVNPLAKYNAHRLENLLGSLREWLKASHLTIHVFNWEMDLEHRYSSAMIQSHHALNARAIQLAAAEHQVAQPVFLSPEEQLISKRYQLENVVQCAVEHEAYLSALLAHPEAYFPPNIVAMCEPPSVGTEAAGALEAGMKEEPFNWMVYGDVLEVPPSSPPKQTERKCRPIRFRC
ncbi:protein bag of marbles [Drosophila kikkawai]|uniref:Protein bag of marbles n=1 Tax=Drosophila kikkawai TaxID=30033 RepID=A0A6P4IE16_DROKI|nr:protein bag-of-marbles [Drosophila kikkawai]